jgi:hypothetical protein
LQANRVGSIRPSSFSSNRVEETAHARSRVVEDNCIVMLPNPPHHQQMSEEVPLCNVHGGGGRFGTLSQHSMKPSFATGGTSGGSDIGKHVEPDRPCVGETGDKVMHGLL